MKKKNNKNKTLYIIILVSLIVIFLADFPKVYTYVKDMNANNKLKVFLLNDVIDVKLDVNNKEQMLVDFEKLINMNKDTVGWIKFNDGKINYPIVQSTDNDYYLDKSFDGKKNQNGSIFMDYRNKAFNDRNTVLFGHSMLDGSMFGSLRDVFKDNFFKKEENNYIKIYTKEEGEITYQIFSYYITDAEDYYITTSFEDRDFEIFINNIKRRSEKDFNVDVGLDDKILTLSTCYGTGGTSKRKVVHAKRITPSSEINY